MSEKRPKEKPMLGPRGRARCRAILDAASALFVEKGFDATSLNDIVARAGGSRSTLYEQFGDKAGLFRAMMEEHCERILDEMEAMQASSDGDPEEGLVQLGLHVVRTLTAPETAAILRVLVSEGNRIPDLVDTFYRIGPARSDDHFADYLRRLNEAGKLRIADPEAAAQAFLGMTVGNLLLRRLIRPEEFIDMASVEAYVRQAVRLFLDGVRPER